MFRAIGRFVSRNPVLTLGLCVVLACVVFGPGTVGAWLGSTGREAIAGGVRFVTSLLAGAF
jgi:hypothetical protein